MKDPTGVWRLKTASVEEWTDPHCWWCDDERVDPWRWREIIARRGKIAYGKFFDKKAGFISLEWLPYFVNARRDGYDFDSAWEDGRVSRREKVIMDLLTDKDEDGDILFTVFFSKGNVCSVFSACFCLCCFCFCCH